MKCSQCGHELKEYNPTKFITLDGWNYEIETHDNGKTLSEIEIPEGYELFTKQDIHKLCSNEQIEKKANLLDCWFFIKQWRKDYIGKYVVGFYADSDRAGLDCFRYPSYSDASLGVRFKWKVKK